MLIEIRPSAYFLSSQISSGTEGVRNRTENVRRDVQVVLNNLSKLASKVNQGTVPHGVISKSSCETIPVCTWTTVKSDAPFVCGVSFTLKNLGYGCIRDLEKNHHAAPFGEFA